MKGKKGKENNKRGIRKSWPFLSCVILQILFFLILHILELFIPYSIDNYRYVFSALLQVIGSMFAFIASSTLVAYQFLSSVSPNSVNYYPKKLLFSFLGITLVVIGIDIVSIMLLKQEHNFANRIVFDFIISLNTYPIVLSLVYVIFVINTISPHSQVRHLVDKAGQSITNEERREIAYSLEEMFLSAIRNGQGGQIRECQNAMCKIIDIFAIQHSELNLNSGHYPDHPLRIVPDIIERISYALIDNNMNNLLHYNGHLLRELSGKRYNDTAIVGVETARAINNIGVYCLEKGKMSDLHNFLANAVLCLDNNNSYSTVFWGCKMLIESAKAYLEKNPHNTLTLIENILEEIDCALGHDDIPSRPKSDMIGYLQKQSWLGLCSTQYNNSKIPKLLEEIVQKQ